MGGQHTVLGNKQINEKLGGDQLRSEWEVEVGEDDIFGFASAREEVYRGNESSNSPTAMNLLIMYHKYSHYHSGDQQPHVWVQPRRN